MIAASFACALVLALPAGAIVLVRSIRPGEIDSLRTLEARAERAKGADLEPAWYGVARYAVELANAHGDEKSVKQANRTLNAACERLPASSLAAVAAWGSQPTLSAAFARAIARVDVTGRGSDVSARAEAAAECRDALALFGPGEAGELLGLWKEYGRAGFGAGGATSSVYRIAVVGPGLDDSSSSEATFVAGLRAGVASAAGPLAGRFQVLSQSGVVLGAPWRKFELEHAFRDGPGIVVALGSAEADMASGLGVGGRVATVDARPAESLAPEELEVIPAVESFDPSVFGRPSPPVFRGDSLFRYPIVRFIEDDPGTGATERWHRSLVTSPMGVERARRLLRAIASTAVESVAVAVPETGGDLALARAVIREHVRNRAGRDVVFVPFVYAPGRRNYAPEAQRFRETGCDAILLCGASDESAEWLTALAAARLRPQVFAGSGFDPAGYHETVRRAAEGAIFVASEWRAIGTLAQRLASARTTAGRAQDDVEFERGFIAGESIARRVVAGNCSPGLWIDAATDESPGVFGMAQRMLNPGAVPSDPGPPNAEVPVYRIRNGVAERVALP